MSARIGAGMAEPGRLELDRKGEASRCVGDLVGEVFDITVGVVRVVRGERVAGERGVSGSLARPG